MPHRLYDDEKIKLILLYLLNELDDSYDFQTISEIIVWDGTINYFVFTDCFNQLLATGAIIKTQDPDGGNDLYSISERGRESILMLEDTLVKFIKERIMRSATRLLAFKRDGSSIATIIENEEEGYRLSCTLKNKKFDLLKLQLYLDNKEEAELLQLGFDRRAEHIYSSILALLSEDTKFLT